MLPDTPLVDSLEALVTDVHRTFDRVHRERFLGDPAANPRLGVAVVDAALVADTPALVLLTPWTINGLAFPPDDVFPATLTVAGRVRPAHHIDMPELGVFWSVNLPTETAGLRGMAQAHALANSWAQPFREAVRAIRQPMRRHPG